MTIPHVHAHFAPLPVPGCACLMHDARLRCNAALPAGLSGVAIVPQNLILTHVNVHNVRFLPRCTTPSIAATGVRTGTPSHAHRHSRHQSLPHVTCTSHYHRQALTNRSCTPARTTDTDTLGLWFGATVEARHCVAVEMVPAGAG